jgi:hypothetical protein
MYIDFSLRFLIKLYNPLPRIIRFEKEKWSSTSPNGSTPVFPANDTQAPTAQSLPRYPRRDTFEENDFLGGDPAAG